MRIISAIKLLALTVFTAVTIAACNGATNLPIDRGNRPLSQLSATPTDCRTIEHQSGKTEVCGQPKRIVVLGPNMLELLLALDVQPAGYADQFAFYRDYDNPHQQIPYLGHQVDTQPVNVGVAYGPSIEAILKVQPDLIIGSQWLNQQYKILSNIAPTLLFKLLDVDTNLRAIAQAVGRSEKAEELIAKRQQQIADAREDFAPVVSAHPKVLMISSYQMREINIITHLNSFCGSLVEDLGFGLVYPPGMNENALSSTSQISLEILPQLNKADSVILLGYNQHPLKKMDNFEEHQLKTIEQTWEKNAIAQSLQASKAERVYFIPAYICFGLPGPIGTKLYLNKLREQMLSNQ